jgi:drug/metabolite transporter (DMT)-like permease
MWYDHQRRLSRDSDFSSRREVLADGSMLLMDASDDPPQARVPSKLAGRLSIVAAAILWSSSGLFAKWPIFDVWPASTRGMELAFWRAFFAALVLAPTVRRPRWRIGLVPLAIAFTLMNVTYLTAMSQTTAANAIWLQSTCPWWVFVFSVLVFREPIVRRDLIPLAFGVVGVGTILWFEVQGQARFGVACGLAAGISYAAVVVCMRRLRSENSPWLVALNHGVAALILAPWVFRFGHWPTPLQFRALAAFGALQMAVPYLFLIRGLRAVSSQEAVALGMLEPILIPCWAYLIRNEVPAPWTIAGAAFILAGLVLRYVVWEFWAWKTNAPGGV